MPKIEINQVAEILKRNKADPALLRAVVQELNLLAQAAAEEEKPPAVKKQFVILVSDPEGRFPKDDFAGWVLQIPEEELVRRADRNEAMEVVDRPLEADRRRMEGADRREGAARRLDGDDADADGLLFEQFHVNGGRLTPAATRSGTLAAPRTPRPRGR